MVFPGTIPCSLLKTRKKESEVERFCFGREDTMEVNFHLPGLRNNYPLNMLILSLLKQKPEFFREGIKIASFFGEFPTSLWAGGRLVQGDQCDSNYIRNVIKNINAQGVPVRFTYTNPLIEKDDLEDFYCNFCMQEADNGMNEVMMVSPILEEYIRKTYPSFKINSSTCKEIKDIDKLNEELDKDYYLVVLDYNLNNDWEFLKQIKKPEKCEVLVNTLCVPDCKRRGDHYKNIAQNHRIQLENRKRPEDKQIPLIPWTCEYGDKNCIHTIQEYPTYISPEDIYEKYVPAGFHHFKIEGRTANIFSLVETYCHYLIKPEHQGYIRIQLLSNLAASKVLLVNRPRPSVWP